MSHPCKGVCSGYYIAMMEERRRLATTNYKFNHPQMQHALTQAAREENAVLQSKLEDALKEIAKLNDLKVENFELKLQIKNLSFVYGSKASIR